MQESTIKIIKDIYKYGKYIANGDFVGLLNAIPSQDVTALAYDFYVAKEKLQKYIGTDNFLKELDALPNGLFKGTTLMDIVVPANIETIGKGCFENCNMLATCEIEGPVKIIPQNCFKNCSKLQVVKLPDTIEKIELGAFEGCPENLQILAKKTGRKIRTPEVQADFIRNHFVEVN